MTTCKKSKKSFENIYSFFILKYENENPFYTGISLLLDRITQGMDKIKHNSGDRLS